MCEEQTRMTPLDKPLKRALKINGRDYVIAIDPQTLKITEKGRRLGLELKWAELVSGETALAVALHASLGKFKDAPKAPSRDSNKTPNSNARAKPPASRRTAQKRASKRT
jgi:hypothetical protein